jgi:hypothetical protein
MRLMSKLTSLVLGTMIAAAGCADSATVTGPDRGVPAAPQFDGIGTAGSGNLTGIGTAGSGNSAPTTSTADGIGTAGSGNRGSTDSTTTITGIGTAGSGN